METTWDNGATVWDAGLTLWDDAPAPVVYGSLEGSTEQSFSTRRNTQTTRR